MNYELAKRLKDAGYPILEVDLMAERYPTLSELIEACDSVKNGFKLDYDHDEEWWEAGAYESGIFQGEGPTPEEAVAKLWLALHAHAKK